LVTDLLLVYLTVSASFREVKHSFE